MYGVKEEVYMLVKPQSKLGQEDRVFNNTTRGLAVQRIPGTHVSLDPVRLCVNHFLIIDPWDRVAF